MTDTKPNPMHYEALFRGFRKGNVQVVGGNLPYYPFWLYKDGEAPVLVKSTDHEQEWVDKGYDAVTSASMANKHLINWFWDLEDFSPRQLRVFAMDEYEVDLPEGASQEALFRAVIDLTRAAPQNQNRMIYMAHTIKMNYSETQDQIKEMMEHVPEGATVENIYEEFTA